MRPPESNMKKAAIKRQLTRMVQLLVEDKEILSKSENKLLQQICLLNDFVDDDRTISQMVEDRNC